jgi:two-component system torCAD operon response regulator TorR
MTIQQHSQPPSVLIISQDAGMTRVWKALFEQRNCRVICETSPGEGLSSSRILSPALILLDVNLPDDERLNLCRDLRNTTDGALLMIDSNYKNPDALEYHRAGVDETISAPISPMALLVKSLAWLARSDWLVPRRQSSQSWA